MKYKHVLKRRIILKPKLNLYLSKLMLQTSIRSRRNLFREIGQKRFKSRCSFFQSSVSPLQFASVLEVLKPDESFKRGTSLWQNCCLWLKEISARNDNEEWSADRLCLLVEKSITNRLKITSEMGKMIF